MNKIQKRKFTLALSGLLRAKKDHWECLQEEIFLEIRERSLRNKTESKRLRLYRVVEELVKEGGK